MTDAPHINLQLNDQLTGKTTHVRLSMAEGQRLYLGLQELYGDLRGPTPDLGVFVPSLSLDLSDLIQDDPDAKLQSS